MSETRPGTVVPLMRCCTHAQESLRTCRRIAICPRWLVTKNLQGLTPLAPKGPAAGPNSKCLTSGGLTSVHLPTNLRCSTPKAVFAFLLNLQSHHHGHLLFASFKDFTRKAEGRCHVKVQSQMSLRL